ncbi:MAG TPA: DUF4886 domain-containing protein, partial [Candidatus Krumholzibacterium sp.]|nr:DUF4886 domain-containing protein [Candidatus Krumholzibacterium sp.]
KNPPPGPVYEDPLEILFIGSSYFSYNDLPQVFRSLSGNAGKKYNVTEAIHNGWFLYDHAISSGTEGTISIRDWDFVILQGIGVNIAYPEPYSPYTAGMGYDPLMPALSILEEKIHRNCEDTRILYCLPWAFEDGMTWRGFEDETYEVMQQKAIDNTVALAAHVDYRIAPVGVAWKTVLAEPGLPLHYLHLYDWNHPSRLGTYLTACVIFSSVYRQSCEGIQYYEGIDTEVALHFQQVASETVLGDLEKWKLDD